MVEHTKVDILITPPSELPRMYKNVRHGIAASLLQISHTTVNEHASKIVLIFVDPPHAQVGSTLPARSMSRYGVLQKGALQLMIRMCEYGVILHGARLGTTL